MTRRELAIRAVAQAIRDYREAVQDAQAKLDELLEAVDSDSAEDLIGVSAATREVLLGTRGWGASARRKFCKKLTHSSPASCLPRNVEGGRTDGP